MIFIRIILPVFVTIGLGYALGRFRKTMVKPLADLALYLFTPSLIFSKLVLHPVPASTVGKVAVFSFGICGVSFVAAWLAGVIGRLGRLERYTLLLSTVAINAANYGIPVVQGTLGDKAISIAALFILFVNIVQATLGVYVAAAGRRSPWASFVSVFKLPLVYAFAGAFVVRFFDLSIPEAVYTPISKIGDAAIPLAQVVLGIQLTTIRMARGDHGQLAMIGVIRLLISPLAGICLAWLLGLEGMTRGALLILSAMPTAVNAGLLAVQFDLRPSFVAGAILVTTIASAATLTVLIGWLMAGG